jgi:cyclic pyranopterin phosphate synthase
LTDRCNLRCSYCQPGEGEEPLTPNADPQLLRTEELKRLLSVFVGLGVQKVRLTGGEPTIRGDFPHIIDHLGALSRDSSKPLSLGITTNGVRLRKFLPHFRAAGLRNINLSLDTLAGAKFPFLARRPLEWHTRVMAVMKDVASEEFFNLKVNCVLLRGVNDDEIGDFVDLTEHLPLEVRFLEFMPFDRNGWNADRLVSQADVVASIQRHLQQRHAGAVAERLPPDSIHDVANLWKVPGWRGRLGIIASMTDAFCGGCNRVRLTSDGQLRNCLFGEEGVSLRDHLRNGATDECVKAAIASGVKAKYAKLGGKRDMHELQERGALNLPMVALGG